MRTPKKCFDIGDKSRYYPVCKFIRRRPKVVDKTKIFKAHQKLKDKGYSLAGYARANKFNRNTFKLWLYGKWDSDGPVATSYAEALRRDGLLD